MISEIFCMINDTNQNDNGSYVKSLMKLWTPTIRKFDHQLFSFSALTIADIDIESFAKLSHFSYKTDFRNLMAFNFALRTIRRVYIFFYFMERTSKNVFLHINFTDLCPLAFSCAPGRPPSRMPEPSKCCPTWQPRGRHKLSSGIWRKRKNRQWTIISLSQTN